MVEIRVYIDDTHVGITHTKVYFYFFLFFFGNFLFLPSQSSTTTQPDHQHHHTQILQCPLDSALNGVLNNFVVVIACFQHSKCC